MLMITNMVERIRTFYPEKIREEIESALPSSPSNEPGAVPTAGE